jgi:hypothetical protein
MEICWSKIMFILMMLSKNITLWGGGAMVKDLTPQRGGEKFKSPHLQPKLPWLLRGFPTFHLIITHAF